MERNADKDALRKLVAKQSEILDKLDALDPEQITDAGLLFCDLAVAADSVYGTAGLGTLLCATLAAA